TIIPKVLATPNANLGIDTTVQDVTYDMDLTFPNGGGLVKAGKNKLTLTGAIDYTGDTRIEGGVLAAADGAGLPTASHLTFAGGVWAPLATSTSRALGSGAGELSFTSGLEGGFSAIGAPLTVNLGGAAAALAYGSDLFDPSVLVLNPAGADNPLILANPIDISAKDLTINIDSTDAGAAVTLAGGVSGAHHLTKTGAGTVIFNGPLQLESHWLVLNGGNAEMKNSAITYGPMHDIRVNNGSKLTIDNVTVDMTAWLYAGLDGKNAEVIMESGTLNNAAGRLIVGQNANSSGTFTLKDGTVTTKHLIVGNKGTGEFIQNGGSVTDLSGDGDTVIGEYDNDNNVVGTGTYRMNGGTLTVNDNFQVGAHGTGNIIQSAGDISSSGWFVVGRFAGGVGSYVMTGGTYTSTKNPAIIGESGVGTLDVSKTAVFKAPALRLGSNADGTGSVTVHDGGTLEVTQIN
ncbi:MAG: hypothetical protein J6334_10765, partial [Kiritimatiellae bacterium]|nr:hypothetical protein [Kiritimatiellia bacterium]